MLSPNQETKPPAGYYIIVAAYYSNGKGYAERYSATFEEKGYNGQYAFFPEKKMFMVHLNRHDDFDVAIEEMRKVRSENVKEDAWVYVYRPEDIKVIAEPEPESQPKPEPEPGPVPEPEMQPVPVVVTPVVDQEPIEDEVIVVEEEEEEEEEEPEPEPESEPEPEPESEPEPDPYEGMYPVYFKLHHGVSAEDVEGQIMVIDPGKTRIVTTLSGNEWHYIDKPSNIHHDAQLVAELFGYRKISHVINLDEPERDSTDYFIEVRGDSITVDFELVRYHKGDIFTMFNVYFYSHSAIMKPESVYELDQLLAMLNENSNMNIVVHGHTNGNSAGDMRYKTEEDNSLFSTTGALEKTASAKALSEERANVVRRYLVDKGISPNRMDIKGWGGKRMLYKKTDPQAIKNVRVEIEIVEE